MIGLKATSLQVSFKRFANVFRSSSYLAWMEPPFVQDKAWSTGERFSTFTNSWQIYFGFNWYLKKTTPLNSSLFKVVVVDWWYSRNSAWRGFQLSYLISQLDFQKVFFFCFADFWLTTFFLRPGQIICRCEISDLFDDALNQLLTNSLKSHLVEI